MSCAASTAIGCTRARRIASASPRRSRTRAVPAEPGATTPTRVSVARLRISAVIGIASSSASHTSGEVRCSLRSASRGRPYSRTSAAASAGASVVCARAKPSIRRGRPAVVTAADDPLEQRGVLGRDLELRVAGAHRRARVGEAEQVAVRHAVALAVLDRLERELVRGAVRVPGTDRATQRAAPAAELLDERREVEQVRSGAADVGQRGERGLAGRLVAEPGRHREREDGRVVLRRAAGRG